MRHRALRERGQGGHKGPRDVAEVYTGILEGKMEEEKDIMVRVLLVGHVLVEAS